MVNVKLTRRALPLVFASLVCSFSASLIAEEDLLPAPDIRPLASMLNALPVPAEKIRVQDTSAKMATNLSGFWEARFDQGPTMILIPADSFTMGNDALESDDEALSPAPEHKV